jgi:crotonobetainyl-CoA:carnitine CoA-transferase CaiB-like acyl-CoA transferase
MAIAPEFSRSKPELGPPPPRLGEHNAKLLGALGYSAAEIAALQD